MVANSTGCPSGWNDFYLLALLKSSMRACQLPFLQKPQPRHHAAVQVNQFGFGQVVNGNGVVHGRLTWMATGTSLLNGIST